MNKTKNSNEASAPADKSAQVGSTANGYDCRWVEAIKQIDALREQNRELLAALKGIRQVSENYGGKAMVLLGIIANRARAAIAKAE
jgi:hypothetical protein